MPGDVLSTPAAGAATAHSGARGRVSPRCVVARRARSRYRSSARVGGLRARRRRPRGDRSGSIVPAGRARSSNRTGARARCRGRRASRDPWRRCVAPTERRRAPRSWAARARSRDVDRSRDVATRCVADHRTRRRDQIFCATVGEIGPARARATRSGRWRRVPGRRTSRAPATDADVCLDARHAPRRDPHARCGTVARRARWWVARPADRASW